MLIPCSTPSRVQSQRGKCCFRFLKGSIRKLHRQSEALRSKVSYRSLCRRLRIHSPGALALGKARTRNDICPYCHSWDHKVSKSISRRINEVHALLEGILPGYWGFSKNPIIKDYPAHPDRTTANEEESFIEELTSYILDHADLASSDRSLLSAE